MMDKFNSSIGSQISISENDDISIDFEDDDQMIVQVQITYFSNQ